MIPIISKVISLFTKYSKLLAVIIIMIFSAIFCFQNKELKKRQTEIDRLQNNIEYYQNENSKQKNILVLTQKEFKEINDSLIDNIKEIQKKLKIKDKELKQAQQVQQVIKYDTTLLVKDKDFCTEIKPNESTSIFIKKQDSLLTAKLNIRNTQTLLIQSKKVYKHKYKNWFTRLLHFDFKKKYISDYQIHNSNDLITIEDTKLIEISN